MRLNSQQHEVFATALHSLLTYVNQRCGIVRNDTGASRVDQCMQHEGPRTFCRTIRSCRVPEIDAVLPDRLPS